jgi:hypothetical protein
VGKSDNGNQLYLHYKYDSSNLSFSIACFGAGAVFATSIRIAAALVSKQPLCGGLLPKTGYIGGTGAGFTILPLPRKLITQSSGVTANIGSVSASATPTEISLEKIEHINTNKPINDLLTDFFDLKNNFVSNLKFSTTNLEQTRSAGSRFAANSGNQLGNQSDPVGINTQILEDSDYRKAATGSVIKALDESNPKWRDMFVPSPLDSDENIQFIIDILSNNLLLQYIILYLLVLLLIILTIKLLPQSKKEIRNITSNSKVGEAERSSLSLGTKLDPKLEIIKKYRLGKFIAPLCGNRKLCFNLAKK